MLRLIHGMYNIAHNQYPDVMRGRWELCNSDGEVIQGSSWKSTIKPGDKIEMRIISLVSGFRPRHHVSRPMPMPMPIGGPPPPLRPVIIEVAPSPPENSHALTEEEEKELCVVDFITESQLKDVSLAELLGKYTNVSDVGGSALKAFSFGRFAGVDAESSASDSDTDSDSDSDDD
jgi:hypothetical protein